MTTVIEPHQRPPSPNAGGVLMSVVGLGKRYARDLRRSQHYGLRAIVSELALGRASALPELRTTEFWAVQEVSFAVGRGEALGVLGRNGAGKSTLLRLLAGISKPDAGRVTVHGTTCALLDPNASFNPILTGRENLEVAYALASGGRPSPDQIAEIAAYAELSHVLDAPLRTFSSGMRMRLAFATMIHVNADLLLIDEALAVGDTAFQLRCLDEIRNHCRRGGAVVFASHSLWLFHHLASRGIHLVAGTIQDQGAPGLVADRYLAALQAGSWIDGDEGPDILDRELGRAQAGPIRQAEDSRPGPTHTVGAADVAAEMADIGDVSGRPVSFARVVVSDGWSEAPRCGGPLQIDILLRSREAVHSAELLLTLWTGDGAICVGASASEQIVGGMPNGTMALPAGDAGLRLRLDAAGLAPGRYGFKAAVVEHETQSVLGLSGYEDSPTFFRVLGPLSDEPDDLVAVAPTPLCYVDVEWPESSSGAATE